MSNENGVKMYSMFCADGFNLNHGLECVSRQDLSACKKGQTITLFGGKDIFTWTLMPKDNKSELIAAGTLDIGGKCGNISKCAGHEGSNMVSKIYNILEEPHVSTCLNLYCDKTSETQFCYQVHVNEKNNFKDSPNLSINISSNSKTVQPACSVVLRESSREKVLDLKCTMRPEFVGVNSTITLLGLRNETHGKCSDDGIRIKKIALNALFQSPSEARAHCSLIIPNSNQNQAGCNFSLYINPRTSNITVGESVDLTCPQSATNMTWWEIRSKELISLEPNVSVVSHNTVTFRASTPNENGFIIMCKDGVVSGDTEIVLGIGKVFVTEASETSSNSNPYIIIISILLLIILALITALCMIFFIHRRKEKTERDHSRNHHYDTANHDYDTASHDYDTEIMMNLQNLPIYRDDVNLTENFMENPISNHNAEENSTLIKDHIYSEVITEPNIEMSVYCNTSGDVPVYEQYHDEQKTSKSN